MDKFQRLALEKKTEQKKQVRLEKRSIQKDTKNNSESNGEGIIIGNKRKHVSVTDCNDVETLKEMMENSFSRGKKQRIRKKIQQLKNPQDASINTNIGNPNEAGKSASKSKELPAKLRVENLLKKREEKI